jgi:hypothetical protein
MKTMNKSKTTKNKGEKIMKITTMLVVALGLMFSSAYAQISTADPSIDSTMSVSQSGNTLLNFTQVTATGAGNNSSPNTVLTVLLPVNVKVTQISFSDASTTCVISSFPVQGVLVDSSVRCNLGIVQRFSSKSVKISTTLPPPLFPKTFAAFVINDAPDRDTTNNFRTATPIP